MRLIVDTDVLVRAVLDDDPQSSAARRLLDDAEVIAIPLVSLCEFVGVMRRRYRRPRAEIGAALAALTAGAKVIVDDGAVAAGLAFLAAGGDFADGVIAHDGRRLGGEVFATFDKRARRIAAAAGVAVVDP